MWKAITSFFPGGDTSSSTTKAPASFTSAAGIPAQAAPISTNKKLNVSSSSSLLGSTKIPSFSSNLKQGVNYADPSNEEVYNLKISKPKFNAGDANPFFVNVPAKKYKVLVPENPDVEPTEEITNSTLRFYGSSAENVYKKAKTYRTSAKSKHNTLLQKAQMNYRTRVTQRAKNAGKARSNLLKQRGAQEARYRKQIQDINTELNDLLTRLDLAQKKVVPGTAFKKARAMTNSEQAREIRFVKQRIDSFPTLIQELQAEMAKVSGLPTDIQTALQGVLAETRKASQIAASVPVAASINITLQTKPENRNRLRQAASTAGKASSSTSSGSPPSSPRSPSSISGIEAGFGASAAAARLARRGRGSNTVSALRPETVELLKKGNAAAAAKRAASSSATVPPPPIKATEAAGEPSGNTPIVPKTNTAAVPPPQAAGPPQAPTSGGSRKQKKRHARSAKRKTGKSRKH